ncbi:MAG: helix-turn-helix domain-containing protein [Bacteroidetes bacterium]|nr:helix-turn-helix domain-containing protein [Bacteroidota bacterium]
MKEVLKICMLLLLLLHTRAALAQDIPMDSVMQKDYTTISNAYYNALDESHLNRANYFADTYLRKATKEGNILEQIHGHYFKYELSEFTNALLHLDIIIELAISLKDDPIYPEYAYFLKGGLHYDQKDFNKALDNYLLSLELAEKKNNQHLVAACKNSIGLLKAERIGQERDALKLLKQSLKFYDTIEDKKEYSFDYAALLFSLSENYRKLHLLDSSTYYNKKGLIFSEEHAEVSMYNYFIYAEGINLFLKGYPKSAITNLEESLDELNIPNRIIAHYYLSKSYEELGDYQMKIMHLKMLDSVQKGHSIYMIELRYGIEDLIDYHKGNGDLKNQLTYVKKLISLDSIYINDYKSIAHTLNVKYDNKNLIQEKELLLQQLNSSVSSSKKLSYLIILLVLSLITIFYYFYEKQRKQRKRFEEIISTETPKIKNVVASRTATDLPSAIIEAVLEKLEAFELSCGYIQPNLNTYDLCKIINTNKKYLVKVLRHTKEKGVIPYINDLRVTHAMDRLKIDATFRKYTIKAIAEEVGFSNTKSFNKSFDRVFKMTAKSFIEEFKKRSVNSTN